VDVDTGIKMDVNAGIDIDSVISVEADSWVEIYKYVYFDLEANITLDINFFYNAFFLMS
jgi:hypothetical protein